MKRSAHSGFTIITILLGIVVLGTFGAGAYFYLGNKPSSQNTEPTETNQTINSPTPTLRVARKLPVRTPLDSSEVARWINSEFKIEGRGETGEPKNYILSFKTPQNYSVTETNKRIETSTFTENNVPKESKRNCADYKITGENLELSIKRICNTYIGRYSSIPEIAIEVKKITTIGELTSLIRYFDEKEQNYNYVTAYDSEMSDSSFISKVLRVAHDGIFVVIEAKYFGPESMKEINLAVTDEIVAQLLIK